MDKVEIDLPEEQNNNEYIKKRGVIMENNEPVILHIETTYGEDIYTPVIKNEEGRPDIERTAQKEGEPREEYIMSPKQLEIEARLRELGIMKKQGRSWKVPYVELLRIMGEYSGKFNETRHKITAEEVAYSVFCYQVPDPKERKKVAYISYMVTPTIVVTWAFKEETKKQEKVEKKGKFRRAGHLADQMLKYTYPRDRSPQLSFNWEGLPEVDKKKIEEEGIQISEIVEGIRLSSGVHKLIDCLCKMLHYKSQTADPGGKDYFTGNKGYELIQYGPDKNTPAPKLAFTLYELTKEYKGGEAISGKDVENVRNILQELNSKHFLMSYIETVPTKDGGRIENKIEGFKKLIEILKMSQTLYSKDNIELSKTEETIIALNPIFRRQIDSKFILYPNDITRRTIIAYGSHNLSETVVRLRDYLAREMSRKTYSPVIYLDRLYYLLNEKWMKEGRKKKVKEFTDKALETCKTLGIILDYKIEPGATGEPKITFTLNKKWE